MKISPHIVSFITLALAVVLPALCLALLHDKVVGRILFLAVLLIGYSFVLVLWTAQRRGRRAEEERLESSR